MTPNDPRGRISLYNRRLYDDDTSNPNYDSLNSISTFLQNVARLIKLKYIKKKTCFW